MEIISAVRAALARRRVLAEVEIKRRRRPAVNCMP